MFIPCEILTSIVNYCDYTSHQKHKINQDKLNQELLDLIEMHWQSFLLETSFMFDYQDSVITWSSSKLNNKLKLLPSFLITQTTNLTSQHYL